MNKTISNIDLLTHVQMSLIDDFHQSYNFDQKLIITEQLIDLSELITEIESKNN